MICRLCQCSAYCVLPQMQVDQQQAVLMRSALPAGMLCVACGNVWLNHAMNHPGWMLRTVSKLQHKYSVHHVWERGQAMSQFHFGSLFNREQCFRCTDLDH